LRTRQLISRWGRGLARVSVVMMVPDPGCVRHSGMVRKHQIRNLEIPGSMLRIAPE
jgi:hypothetical protein